jgi:hypothetical protein
MSEGDLTQAAELVKDGNKPVWSTVFSFDNETKELRIIPNYTSANGDHSYGRIGIVAQDYSGSM